MRDLYDEILDDLEKQEKTKNKNTEYEVLDEPYEIETPLYETPTDDNIDNEYEEDISLNDLERYDMTDDEEDKFDVNYRTPDNIEVLDLIPTDYKLIKKDKSPLSAGTKGYYDILDDEKIIFDENFDGLLDLSSNKSYSYKEKRDIENKMRYDRIFGKAIHEETHRNWYKPFDLYGKDINAYDNRQYNKRVITDSPQLLELDYEKGRRKGKYEKEINTHFNDIVSQFDDPFYGNQPVDEIKLYKKEKQLGEIYARHAENNPESIINSRTKLERNLNRLWFD